ncbi:MAG: sensor histidine kinase [Candidatus Acidiferrales bacterium]
MHLSLKTKFTLVTALLVLAVVTVVSTVYLLRLTRQVVRETSDRAQFVAQLVFHEAQQALTDAAERGDAPVSSSPADVRQYVRYALVQSAGMNSLLESTLGYSQNIYEITIADGQGSVLLSTDTSLPGKIEPHRPPYTSLSRAGFLQQLKILYGPTQVYEFALPFNLGGTPYGDVRVGISSVLLRTEISPELHKAAMFGLGAVLISTLFAALASNATLYPLKRISAQLDRISAGETDVAPVTNGGELGQVSTKISRIGQQLRDVREIFSTLRENLNQVMTGLEDGLLLFNADGRAMLVSPSAEKFLGMKSQILMGRLASEIFPEGHPLQQALHMQGDQIDPVEAAEVRLEGAGGPVHASASTQVITENGSRMGVLLTLRDLDSLERIGSQLQVSERLSALGRATAGVAHEVKNPLNSMRLWLENLKSSLPSDHDGQQAVRILDEEIGRLDRVVKTFLDFSRPVELHLEETDLGKLIDEVLELAQPQIEAAQVTAIAEVPPLFPPASVDRQLIKQALLNLVLNACEVMTPGGTLTVTLRRVGDLAEVLVADTGPGIPVQNRAKVFQLFFTTRPGGSGMGLATTFRIVQLHNGSIDFTSELGKGTTFRIELPLA